MFFRTYLTDLIKNREIGPALQKIHNNEEINSCTYWHQYTPLHLAVETGQAQIVDALLAADANVNAVTYHDWLTPLHIAANVSDLRSIEALIKFNPNLNAKTYNDQDTPLHIVVRLGLLQHAEVLLKAGAIIDTQNKNKETPLHIASKQGNVQMVDLLLSYNANCNIHNSNDQTALFVAMMHGHAACAKSLMNYGADFGNSFNSVKKLQENYDAECKKNTQLLRENSKLSMDLAVATNELKDAKNQIAQLQQKLNAIVTAIPTAIPVEESPRYSAR
jgi:ankyrin repeat protein